MDLDFFFFLLKLLVLVQDYHSVPGENRINRSNYFVFGVEEENLP